MSASSVGKYPVFEHSSQQYILVPENSKGIYRGFGKRAAAVRTVLQS